MVNHNIPDHYCDYDPENRNVEQKNRFDIMNGEKKILKLSQEDEF